MALDREALANALVARLKAKVPALLDVERRWKPWAEVEASAQPRAFVVLGGQTPSYGTNDAPAIWSLSFTLYVYARNDADPTMVRGTTLATLIDAVEAALEWDGARGDGAGGYPGTSLWQTTLGGLCRYARIAGSIETDEGALGDQAVAVITVEIKAGA